MKTVFFICVLGMASRPFSYSYEINSTAPIPGKCEVWGRVVAPSSILERGLELEIVGEASAFRQRVPVVDGSFELEAKPAGLYQLRIVDHTGQVILVSTRNLKGVGDYLLLRFRFEDWEDRSTNVVSFQALRSQVSSKGIKAFRDGEKAAESGQLAKSVEFFEKAVALSPHFPQAEADLAMSYLSLGQASMALQHAQRAYELDPGFPDAGQILAMLLLRAKRYVDAEDVLRGLVRTHGQIGEFHGLLAVSVIGRGGNVDEAFEHLKIAAAEFPMARLLVANVLVETHRRELALSQVKTFIRSTASACERQQLENWIAQETASTSSTTGLPNTE